MASPKLVYSVVARGSVVLAEHAAVAGNAHLLAMRVLEKLGDDDIRVSYTQERHMFHVLVSEGVTFLVVADESFGRRLPFGFLEDIKQRFMGTYKDGFQAAVAYEYNEQFSKVLAERMHFYATDPGADAINRVTGQVLEVKNIMIENIERILERGEKLDLLVDKTEVLQEGALTFRREARRVRQTLWWKSAKLWVVMAVALVALLYFIMGLVCGFTLDDC